MERVRVDFVMIMQISNEIVDSFLFLDEKGKIIKLGQNVKNKFLKLIVIQVNHIEIRVQQIEFSDSTDYSFRIL